MITKGDIVRHRRTGWTAEVTEVVHSMDRTWVRILRTVGGHPFGGLYEMGCFEQVDSLHPSARG